MKTPITTVPNEPVVAKGDSILYKAIAMEPSFDIEPAGEVAVMPQEDVYYFMSLYKRHPLVDESVMQPLREQLAGSGLARSHSEWQNRFNLNDWMKAVGLFTPPTNV